MATKSYSKHKEYKEYSSSGNIPYTDEQFDMIKSDLIPKGSKLDSLGRGPGAREYHYEYKEEKHPSGKYDRKDLHTVEEYTIPPRSTPKSSESSSYYFEREERDLPAITHSGTRTYNYESSSATPGYSRVKTSKVTKDLSQNVEELDSLLDDLQKDQERQLYKNGYASDTAESTSFDYKRGTTTLAPSSGYSTLKREERLESSSWGAASPPPPPAITRAQEVRQELYREEKTESRVIPSQISPAIPQVVPPVVSVCTHCHQGPSTGTLPRGTPMNKVTTTVKTYTYEVPAGQDPTTVPIPDHRHHTTYVTEDENISTLSRSPAPVVSPHPGGCQYCSHCNSSIREYRTVTRSDDRSSERMVYPAPANETKVIPSEPHNGHGPYSPSSYKFSESTYSSHNSTQRYPPSPLHPAPPPSPGPFPRPTTPSPGTQQPPKKLDDLLADFPEARFPTQPDGVVRRRIEVHESQNSTAHSRDTRDVRDGPTTPKTPAKAPAIGSSKNVAGPPVYYPPGHTPFAKKETVPVGGGYQSSAAMQQGGGAYASGRGMYEYESGSKMKQKSSETKTAVPICLPLCCAMPCVIIERMVYPAPANETKVIPSEPHNGHGPYSPSSYKFSESTYSSHNSTQRYPPSPLHPAPPPSPGPFPRPTTPSPGTQQPPKKLDDLLADFPEARFPTQPDGVVRRRIEVHESQNSTAHSRDTRDVRDGPTTPKNPAKAPAIGSSKNVAGPPVYYPPGHTPFAKKETVPVGGGYQSSAAMQQGGGAYASGRGMYEYESGSKMKQKSSETKTAVPICLPLCCAMPCVIM